MKDLIRILGLFLVLGFVLASCSKEAYFPVDGHELELRDGGDEDIDTSDSDTEVDDGDDLEGGDDDDTINDGDGDDDEEDDGDPIRSTE